MPRHPAVGPIRRSRDCTREHGDRRAARQQSCQVRECLTARVGAAVPGHQVPGRPLPLRVHPLQKVVGLRALEPDRPEVAVTIPGEDLGQRPPAEPAVVVEQDHRTLHAHSVEAPDMGETSPEDRGGISSDSCTGFRERDELQRAGVSCRGDKSATRISPLPAKSHAVLRYPGRKPPVRAPHRWEPRSPSSPRSQRTDEGTAQALFDARTMRADTLLGAIRV